MAFSESVKREAKQRANFRCVVCQQPWVEVHHIVPQAEDGSDTLDNAAPLCGTCHNRFGANPVLRKQLREMRDHWWERCAAASAAPGYVELSQQLDDLRTQYVSGQENQNQILGELKDLFIGHFRSAEGAIESATTIGEVLATSSSFSTGMEYTGAVQICPNCGTESPAGFSVCASCGRLLR